MSSLSQPTRRPARVCFVALANDPEFWGADRSLVDTIDVLRERGVEPRVVLPKRGGAVEKELASRGIEYQVIGYRWWMGYKGLPVYKGYVRIALSVLSSLRIAWRAKRWGCDVVYTNTAGICVGAMAAGWWARLPHVWHLREFVGEDHGLHFVVGEERAIRLIDKWSDVVVANSRAVASKFGRAMPAGKMRVVHNMMRLPPDSPPGENDAPARGEKFRCVISGRVSEPKGQADAVRAVGILKTKGVDVELLIVGEGRTDYVDFVKKLVDELGIEDRVKFVGYVTNVFPYYRSSDALLVCSKCEAFGRVTAEAMLCGLPVVGTDTGGTPELVREGVTGLLYSPGDAQKLAQQIKRLADAPEWTKELGANGLKWATENLSPARYADKMLEAINAAVDAKHATPVGQAKMNY